MSSHGDRLDRAIDRAVREMLDVEPPSGLRGRVLNRIELSPKPVVSAFRRNAWWLAGPVAAAAMIVLAVLAPWRHTVPDVEPSTPSSAQVQPAPVLPPPVTAQIPERPRTASRPTPPAAPLRPRAIEDRLVVAALGPDDHSGTGIDPLAPIAPITVAAARPRDIAPKEIAIGPLAPIAELQTAPLSPPDRRN